MTLTALLEFLGINPRDIHASVRDETVATRIIMLITLNPGVMSVQPLTIPWVCSAVWTIPTLGYFIATLEGGEIIFGDLISLSVLAEFTRPAPSFGDTAIAQ